MITTLLAVLKVIGIILLCIIAFCLLVIGSVLFVPIRYKASGAYQETFTCKARITWLLHMISVVFVMDGQNKSNLIIKLFGITIRDQNKHIQKKKEKAAKQKEKRKKPRLKEREKKKAQNKKQQKETQRIERQAEEGSQKEGLPKEASGNISAETEEKQDPKQAVKQETFFEKEEKQTTPEDNIPNLIENKKVKSSMKQKIKEFFERLIFLGKKLVSAIRNIKYTFQRIYDRIGNVIQKIQRYQEIWEAVETQRAFGKCRKHLSRIYRNIKPKKIAVSLSFGTGDPASTGDVLCVYSMLYPWIGRSIVIAPDFDHQVLEGTFLAKGRLTVYVLAWAAMMYFFDKDIKHFKQCFEREEF